MSSGEALIIKKGYKTFHLSGRGAPYKHVGDTKICKTCQKNLPIDMFYKSSAKKGNARQSYCKDCSREKTRLAVAKHRRKLADMP